MVGRRSLPCGMAYFQGRAVKLPGSIPSFILPLALAGQISPPQTPPILGCPAGCQDEWLVLLTGPSHFYLLKWDVYTSVKDMCKSIGIIYGRIMVNIEHTDLDLKLVRTNQIMYFKCIELLTLG